MKDLRYLAPLCFGSVCALLSLGQSCGAPTPPAPNPGNGNPPPPMVTACGLIGNNCEVPTGATPVWIAPADLDDDGDVDLAVANFGADNVSILLNSGAGHFTFLAHLAAGDNPHTVLAEDLDRDGDPDLAIGSFDAIGGGGARIYLNRGNATFTLSGHFPSGNVGNMMAAGDLDRNGSLDLVLANAFSDNLSLLPGGGDGTFGIAVRVDAGNQPTSVAAVDLDGDNDLDLAVAHELDGTVGMFRNLGVANYLPPTLSVVGSRPVSMAAADLDGDGDIDLATADHGIFEDVQDTVSILLNNGNGTFATALGLSVGANPKFIIATDLNGDHRPDLAVANGGTDGSNSGVAVFLNAGGASFLTPVLYAAGDQPGALAAADLDGDGDTDLAVADLAGNQLLLLGNDGKGSFAVAE